MFSARVKINKKDYLACNRYYLKKYLGVKEYVLFAILAVGGVVLNFVFDQPFILIVSGVTILLALAVVAAYNATSAKTFKLAFENRQVTEWRIIFDETGFDVETYEDRGEKMYPERFEFKNLDKAAVLKDRVYLFTGEAVMFYVKYDAMTGGNFIDFCEFIEKSVDASKFRMKTKRKQFPYGR